jgi:peptide/nickel transport system ATP-binding protein
LIASSPRIGADLHYRKGKLPEIAGGIASAAGVAGCAFAPRCGSARSACWLDRPESRQIAQHHLVACPVHGHADSEATHALG